MLQNISDFRYLYPPLEAFDIKHTGKIFIYLHLFNYFVLQMNISNMGNKKKLLEKYFIL